MKRILPQFFLLLWCAACAPREQSSRPILAVSTPPQAQILTELADSAFTILTVLPPGTNPETYDPAMKERIALTDAVAYFTSGVLPFEKVLTASLPDKVEIIDTSKGIALITGTHQHGHEYGENHAHSEADPHISSSYVNAIITAENFTDALIRLDPDRESVYRDRLAAFTARITKAQEDAARKLARGQVHAFAVWHPSLSYFARDFGLHQIAVGQESKEISLTSLSKIVEEARADSVRVFFFQKTYDSRQAENINKAIGSRTVEIDPLAADWESQLNLIVNALVTDN